MAQGTVCRFERGKNPPNCHDLFRLARLYRWPLAGFDPDQELADPITLVPIPTAPDDDEDPEKDTGEDPEEIP